MVSMHFHDFLLCTISDINHLNSLFGESSKSNSVENRLQGEACKHLDPDRVADHTERARGGRVLRLGRRILTKSSAGQTNAEEVEVDVPRRSHTLATPQVKKKKRNTFNLEAVTLPAKKLCT